MTKEIENNNNDEDLDIQAITIVQQVDNEVNISEQWRNLLERWKTKLFVQLWLQERSVYFYDWCNNTISYIVIIVSSASSATLFTSTSHYIQYIVGTLSMLTGILTAVSRQMKPAEKYQEHCITAQKYQILIRKIDAYLSKPESKNIDYEKFTQEVELEMNQLVFASLKPPAWVRNEFRKKYGNISTMLYGKEIIDLMMKDTLTSKYLTVLKSDIKDKNISSLQDVNDVRVRIQELSKLDAKTGN